MDRIEDEFKNELVKFHNLDEEYTKSNHCKEWKKERRRIWEHGE